MKKFFNKVLKKCVTLVLCLTIPCTLFLTACGGGNNDNNNNNPHTHDYKTTWSTSATHHWHDCKGEDCTEKSGYAEHSYTNYVCVCGYEDPNKPSEPTEPSGPSDPGIVDPSGPHTCDFKTTWSKDATHHWHDCKGEDCTEKSGYAEHSYTNYVCICGHEDPNKPTEPSNPTNPTANKYADVVAKIEAQMLSVMEIELDVMLIDIDPADGHLVWWANEGTKLVKYKLTTELIGTTNAEIIQTLEESTRGTRYTLIHTYVSDHTLENNATLVNGLTQTLVGEGYTILVGGVSNTYGNNVDSTLGDISMFDVDLLLEKDGTIYEYNDSIYAARDWQDKTAYEAVTEGVEDVTYRAMGEAKTLGNLAKDYYANSQSQNKYADVVAKIEEQMLAVMEIELDVMLIDLDPADGKLVWWANEGTKLVKYKLGTELIGTTNENIIQALEESTRKTRYTLVDTYTSDKTLTSDTTLINDLTKKLVGDGYTIIVGGVSDTRIGSVEDGIGNYSSFDIDLLLEKDGIIYEYNDTIMASRDWQDKTPYEAVTQGVINVTYKTHSEVKTLGNFAKDFYKA